MLFYVTGRFADENHIGQPAEHYRVMHAMERVHHLPEIRPGHQCHVDAAVQVPPGGSQVFFPIQPRTNRPFIAPCNVVPHPLVKAAGRTFTRSITRSAS